MIKISLILEFIGSFYENMFDTILSWNKKLLVFAFLSILLYLIGAYFVKFGGNGLSEKLNDWSYFGGYFSGVFAFASFIAVVYIALMVKNYEKKKLLAEFKHREFKEFSSIYADLHYKLNNTTNENIDAITGELKTLASLAFTRIPFNINTKIKFDELSNLIELLEEDVKEVEKLKIALKPIQNNMNNISDELDQFEDIGFSDSEMHLKVTQFNNNARKEKKLKDNINIKGESGINLLKEVHKVLGKLLKLYQQDLIQSTKL